MGMLTKNTPKALVKLGTGETILERQVRLLNDCGIYEFVISTGPFENQIKEALRSNKQSNFKYINNPIYGETNSIYSMYLSRHMFDDDFIILHGDLVFDKSILNKIVQSNGDTCLINTVATLPQKDFKAKIIDKKLMRISVDIFDENCFAFQPLYKLTRSTIDKWLISIESMILDGIRNVYAENALNLILDKLDIKPLLYNDDFIDEIDNPDDLKRVSDSISSYDYRNQLIVKTSSVYEEIDRIIKQHKLSKPLLVFNDFMYNDSLFSQFIKENKFSIFTSYSSNPVYEEVLEGIKIFNNDRCDSLIAIGGGSTIDVAKAIKMFLPLDPKVNYLEQQSVFSKLKIIAAPTTAGTGSESTRYSVIYYRGEKQSLVHDSILPDVVLLDPSFLVNLPEYHKKASLLDAFCQSVESCWSINSTVESREYSKASLEIILSSTKDYLKGDFSKNMDILYASNLAGKAINITQTTAPHAMSYKLTSLTKIAHGHAVALCLPGVFEYMINHLENLDDPRGTGHFELILNELMGIFKATTLHELHMSISDFIKIFNLPNPTISNEMIDQLVDSVNLIRLKNHPITLSRSAIHQIYMNISGLK